MTGDEMTEIRPLSSQTKSPPLPAGFYVEELPSYRKYFRITLFAVSGSPSYGSR